MQEGILYADHGRKYRKTPWWDYCMLMLEQHLLSVAYLKECIAYWENKMGWCTKQMISHKISWILFSVLQVLSSLCVSVSWPVNSNSNNLLIFYLAVKLDLPLLTKCFDILKWKRDGFSCIFTPSCWLPESGRRSQEKDHLILLLFPIYFSSGIPTEAILF